MNQNNGYPMWAICRKPQPGIDPIPIPGFMFATKEEAVMAHQKIRETHPELGWVLPVIVHVFGVQE